MNGISELNYYSKFARLLYSFTYILDLIFFLNQKRYTLNQIKIAFVVYTSLASDRFLQKVSKLDSIFKSNQITYRFNRRFCRFQLHWWNIVILPTTKKRNPIFYIEFDNAADKIGIIDFDQFQQMGLNKLPLFQQAAFSHFKTTIGFR